jgi:hypothetical protein
LSIDHELLLEWVSELANGTWDQFRRVNDWLFNPEGVHRETKPGATANTLAILGHLEVDWDSDRWAVAPPVLTVLPSAGAHLILVGCRTRHLKRRLHEYAVDNSNIYVSVYPQLEAPDAIFIATDDERHAVDLASYLEVNYDFSAAERLSELLPTFDSHLSLAVHAVPTRGFGVKRFRAESLGWEEATTDLAPGLYKYEAYGRPEFRYVESQPTFLSVDLPLGIYAELKRTGRSILSFEEEELNGTLVVPARAPLPWLQARCATLCSGLEPWLERTTWTRRYVNVPQAIAVRIARSLDQELTIQEMPEGPSDLDKVANARQRIQHIRFSE